MNPLLIIGLGITALGLFKSKSEKSEKDIDPEAISVPNISPESDPAPVVDDSDTNVTESELLKNE